MRKHYTPEQREQALELLNSEGIWTAVAATGVHHTTIYRWNAEHVRSLNQTPEEVEAEVRVSQAMRSQLQQRFMQVALAHVDRSDTAKNGRDAQAYATAAAILHDKFRLEMGEATSRIESRDLDAAVKARHKVDDLAERRKQKSA